MQPYAWFAAILLFLSYIIGLWFTLRTHAALIWAENEEKKAAHPAPESVSFEPRHLLLPPGIPEATGAASAHKDSIRESQLYKRILGQSLRQVGLNEDGTENWDRTDGVPTTENRGSIPHMVPPRSGDDGHRSVPKTIHGFTGEDNERLVRQVTEVAATAAAVAARDAGRNRKLASSQSAARQTARAPGGHVKPGEDPDEAGLAVEPAHAGGHDAPNWSKAKSSIILLGATILYAIIAEILVDTVDVVLESVDIDEKFLGITLFALVPNTTEFLVCVTGSLLSYLEIKRNAHALTECYLICNEWQHCAVHGDRLGVRIASLPVAGPSSRPFQRFLHPHH